jgi:hypothetical protein
MSIGTDLRIAAGHPDPDRPERTATKAPGQEEKMFSRLSGKLKSLSYHHEEHDGHEE